MFWQLMIDLARQDHVTIFISTHFMNEAERCDRISLMHAGRVLVSDTPAELIDASAARTRSKRLSSPISKDARQRKARRWCGRRRQAPPASPTLAAAPSDRAPRRLLLQPAPRAELHPARDARTAPRPGARDAGAARLRDPDVHHGLRHHLDVENLTYAVLDRDRTTTSQNYALNLAGSRYFVEQPPIADYEDLDRRMRTGELSLAIEIPPGFARDIARGSAVQIGAWVDGAMPPRAETVHGYVHGMHQLAGSPSRRARRPGRRLTHRPRSKPASATTPTSRVWWRWCPR